MPHSYFQAIFSSVSLKNVKELPSVIMQEMKNNSDHYFFGRVGRYDCHELIVNKIANCFLEPTE
jgi:hypothetical protein